MGAFLMANTYNEHNGTGSQDTFAYTFPYLKTTDVKVSVDGVVKQLTTDYTRPSVTTIQFNSDKKPANGAKVRIYRDTDEATANSTFYPGSAIKSSDLNDNFLQAIYIGEEGKENADDAWNKLEDSIDSTETWVSDNTKIGTTGAVDARVDSKINTELTSGSKNFNTSGTLAAGATTVTGNIAVSGTVDGRDVAADGTKLDGIESGATADQTNAEIRAAIEAASDSNVFTDADHSKLNAIEASATADQTASEIKTAYESNSDTNAFTNADHTKLDGIATSANNYTHPNHSGEVTSTADGATVIADDVVDEANLKISNAGSNGQYLQKQSGNTGGLTWASVSGGGGSSVGGSTGIDFNDNVKIRFGDTTTPDLEIYHDGSNSYIEEDGTGQLIIRSWAPRIQAKYSPSSGSSTGEDAIICMPDGAVELYYDDVKRFETYSESGVHGIKVFDNVVLPDGGKVRFGNSTYGDLQIGHDGANSYISDGSGVGDLIINSNTIRFKNAANDEHLAIFDQNSFCALYFDDKKKLTTYSKGVEIHGSEGENCELYLYADEGDDDNDNWKLSALAASSTFQLQNRASGSWETNIEATGNGAVELYYDGLKNFETTASGAKVNGNFQLLKAGRTNLSIGSTDAGGAVIFLDGDSNGDISGNDYAMIEHTTSGDLCFYGNNPNANSKLKFYTNQAATLALTLDGANASFAGNVGLGSTPNRELHVKGLDVALRLESTAATGRIGTEFYDTSAQKGFFGYPSSSNDNMCIQQNEAANFYIDVNGSTALTLDTSQNATFGGNVGLGTSPNEDD